ncbi:2-hydroxyacid dehydrogenase [Yersinia enterocolitica]|uniref:2-hydroxyacid dehydrogenase n=1 Tax=Yersinia enterocolitica TaxID=630 RepID=UPI002AC37448|nr:2-hydroxyacid dehydrogenase [Yersinia enterocolitica]EKN3944903.1 2-hydroxyacid dehydrogenase [Yersinia enterocolitica]HEN3560557.1 2-hydroxyacid dehydrogenase [Yersinia enterocolitica]HEN3564681.1 2-hydroxyacid dehydrogenase [Yersinia enterocolitica]
MKNIAVKHKVLKQASLPDQLNAQLNALYDVYEYNDMAAGEFDRLAAEFRVVLTNGEAVVSREFIERLPNLELISDFGVGYDGIDVAAARERDIAVTHTPGVLTDDVADLAMGLILATSRQIPGAQRFIEEGAWQKGGYPWTRKVSGARLGIIGMGRIGRTIAKRAAAFDMSIAYTDRAALADMDYTFYATLLSLAEASDFLVVCTNGGAETRGLVNRDVLNALGAEGILINISRGSVVDERALIEAIEEGTLGGAGLDVFTDEPQVPQALLHRANVVATPHMASATWATRKEMSRLVLENVNAYFSGEPLVTPIPQ